MPKVKDVLIVGGGIAGLTLAVGLGRRGIRAEVAEIHRVWTVLGVGITVTGPTLRALGALGLLEECLERGFPYNTVRMCDALGNVVQTIDMPRVNGPRKPACLGMLRPDLHHVLLSASGELGAKVRLGVTVKTLTQTADRVEVEFTDGSQGTYDLVVGADGFRSTVRQLTFADVPLKLRYTGQAVWRAMVPRPREVDGMFLFYGESGKPGLVPCPNDQMLLFHHSNVPDNQRMPDDRLHEFIRIELDKYGGLLARGRDHILAPEQVSYRPVEALIMPPPWYRGRIVLIGDAAHTTGPHLASGGGMAVEDAVVLSETLGTGAPLPEVLSGFMSRRYERSRMVVENSLQLGEWEKDSETHGASIARMLEETWRALAQPI